MAAQAMAQARERARMAQEEAMAATAAAQDANVRLARCEAVGDAAICACWSAWAHLAQCGVCG